MDLMEPVGSQPGERARDVADILRRQRIVELPTAPDAATALGDAALVALGAPSVHNTQPWHWRVCTDRLQLYADERWRLPMADPDGRLLMLSCGVGLHHARVALRAMGYLPAVRRFPDQNQPGLLATVTVDRPIPVTERARDLVRATASRQTDRRPVTDLALPGPAITAMRRAAGSEGAWLHLLNPEQTRKLLAAAEHAERAEFAESGYRRELAAWTDRPEGATAGIPGTVLPTRGDGYQANGSYTVLYGTGDRRGNWLRGGEALSAVWLDAIVHGLVVQPISSVIEVPAGRAALHLLLSGIGCPYLVLRIGVPETVAAVVSTPRRAARESIDTATSAATATDEASASGAEPEPR